MSEQEQDVEILHEVFDEALDMLSRACSAFDALENPGRSDEWQPLVEEVYRSVHTVKGNCAAVGWESPARRAHEIEAEISPLQRADTAPDHVLVQKLRGAVDELEQMIRAVVEVALFDPASAKRATPIPPLPAPRMGAATGAPAQPLELRAPRTAHIAVSAPLEPSVAAPARLTTATALVPQGRTSMFAEGQDSLRVPVQSVNGALNHIWEVFLLHSQIAYLFDEHQEALKQSHSFVQAWEPLDAALRRHVTELETVVMSMRLMTLRSLFARMHQIVRSYAASHAAKEVELQTSGDEIQVDKRVLDRLGEPFIHLVRNAIDHGIESTEGRLAAGKPRRGLVRIQAESTADRIVIRVSDDGRGIVAPSLLAKAREIGIDTSTMSDDESALQLIFRPGFSTAESVTGVSGRGVGMDAVRKSVGELGGSVAIETVPGRGTTFVVTLPVSVSIVPVALFEVNGETYATHVAGVIEVCRVPPSDLHRTANDIMFRFRDRFIRCVDLRDHMHGEKRPGDEEASICVVRRAGTLLGLRVTRVVSTTEVVVKPLPALSPMRAYVHGVSILPTGQAIFVLSLELLAEHLFPGVDPRASGGNRVAA